MSDDDDVLADALSAFGDCSERLHEMTRERDEARAEARTSASRVQGLLDYGALPAWLSRSIGLSQAEDELTALRKVAEAARATVAAFGRLSVNLARGGGKTAFSTAYGSLVEALDDLGAKEAI